MAEKEGFEPSYGVTRNTLSKRAVSTTHAPLQNHLVDEHNLLSEHTPQPNDFLPLHKENGFPKELQVVRGGTMNMMERTICT